MKILYIQNNRKRNNIYIYIPFKNYDKQNYAARIVIIDNEIYDIDGHWYIQKEDLWFAQPITADIMKLLIQTIFKPTSLLSSWGTVDFSLL